MFENTFKKTMVICRIKSESDLCYPFDLLSYKCLFSTDRVKEAINVDVYVIDGISNEIVNVLYKLFHSVIDQIISRQITAHYTSPCYFPINNTTEIILIEV